MGGHTLLTSSEPKDQATKAKSVAGTKRSRSSSYPGDEETECLDATLNPFAEDDGGSRPKTGWSRAGHRCLESPLITAPLASSTRMYGAPATTPLG